MATAWPLQTPTVSYNEVRPVSCQISAGTLVSWLSFKPLQAELQ